MNSRSKSDSVTGASKDKTTSQVTSYVMCTLQSLLACVS